MYSHFKSQYKQDQIVFEKFFNDNNQTGRFFVDIGAYDGVHISNSYFFEKILGWKGICVEPIKEIFDKLVENRSSINLNCCISTTGGKVDFLRNFGYTEMLSGITDLYDPRHMQRIDKENNDTNSYSHVFSIDSRPLSNILDEYKISYIDYLSVDVEGAELEVIKSIDFNKVKIGVMIIESNFPDTDNEITELLKKNGYVLADRIAGDNLFVSQDKMKVL